MPDVTLMGATYPDVPAVTLPSGESTATFYYPDEIDYASSPSSGGNANRANAILYGTVDSTSTATAYTATVEGLTALVDGTCVMLHNGVVTSAAGFTVNVNGLGAKKCYNNMTNATQDTTIFNVAYTMLFVYSTALDGGNGGWWIYRGYDANTNTIGYQVRTNSGNKTAADTGYRYRIWLTSADGSKWVPINTSTSTNATTARTLNTRHIDPFGPIVYRATNGTCTSGTGLGATGIWQQYTLTIGYSYMASGFSLTFPASVYLKCTPNADGSATMNSIVQALPTSKDGKIYIYLGTAYSATNMELEIFHPVYWHDGTGIRAWTGAEGGGGGGSTVTVTPILTSGTQTATISVDGTDTTLYAPTPPTVPSASSTAPSMDGTAAAGTSTDYARADHVHPTDTSRQAALVSGTNIKTINSQSILGSGDLAIQEGTEMVVLKYGISTWADFEAVYPNAVVYCRASSNSNPASGAQTRMAFMAYVNSEDAPTEVEFQYYRSVSTKSATQQGDQVFVYKLNKTSGWSVTTREASTKIAAGTGMTQSYASGTLTLQAPRELPTVTSSDNGKVLGVVNGAWAATSSGGGGSSWTDISSLFTAESVDPNLFIEAWTDGQMVYVTGLSDIGDVAYPNGYYPSWQAVGSLVSMGSGMIGCCIADPASDRMEYLMSDGTGSPSDFMFSIIYPISSS